MKTIQGILPVVSTPMTQDGNVDVSGLERLLDFLLGREIGGLWVLGTGSEDMNLAYDKRLTVARTVTGAVQGRCPLVLGSSFYALEDILRFMEDTASLPVDGLHVTPYHPLLSPEGLERFYVTIAERAPKPLWLYTSGNWSLQLAFEAIDRLKQHPNVAGIKYSNVNAVAAARVIEMADETFQVITAVAGQTYASFCMGSKAHTSSLASCLPEPLVDIHRLFLAGRHDEALAAQRRLSAFLRKFVTSAKRDNFLMAAEEKYVLSLRGICEEWVAPYYRGLDEEGRTAIRQALDEHGYFQAK